MDLLLYSLLGLPLIVQTVTDKTPEDWGLTALAALAAIGGVYLVKRGSGSRESAAALQKVPILPVAQAKGIVEIVGKVEARDTAIAPFSGLNAAFFYWRVEGFAADWRVLAEGWSAQPFFVADETARAAVEPDQSQVRLTRREYVYDSENRRDQNLPTHLQVFLTQHNIVVAGMIRYSRLRFREWTLLEGDLVHAAGEATEDLGMLRGERDLKVRLRRSPTGLLVLAEEPVREVVPPEEKDSGGLATGILLMLFSLGLDLVAFYWRFFAPKR